MKYLNTGHNNRNTFMWDVLDDLSVIVQVGVFNYGVLDVGKWNITVISNITYIIYIIL